MKNERYIAKREQWRAMIRQRDDRSEIVNYDDPSFPSYSFEGHMDGSSPWIRKVHWHEDVELMTVLTGKMAYNINGSIITVNAGDTIYINSKQLHYSTDSDNTYCTYIITVIHPKILMSSAEVETEYILPVISDPDIQYILWKADDPISSEIAKITRGINLSNGNQFEITRHFFELWHYVLQYASHNKTEFSTLRYQHIECLKDMIGFIKENYTEHISLAAISQAGNVSKSSCNNIFKEYTAHTPNEYLIRYRLDQAMDMLSTTDMSVGTIASTVGFASSSYMTEQFVKCYKMTPRDFRNRRKG